MVFAVVERSIAALLKDIVGNLQQIIRAEVRLAKVDVAEELAKAMRGLVLLALGALFGTMALAFLVLRAVYLLAHFVQPWAAPFTGAFGASATGCGLLGIGARQLHV